MPIENSFNDTPSSAQPINLNSYYLADFSSTTDTDYFSFTVTTSSALAISLTLSYLSDWRANPIIFSVHHEENPFNAIEEYLLDGSVINGGLSRIYTPGEYLVKFERLDRYAYNEFGASYDFKLSSFVSDIEPPIMPSFNPADEDVNVAIDSNIFMVFNENIQRGNGNIVIKTTSGIIVEILDAATSENINISGNTLTINPANDFEYGTDYAIELDAGSIKDIAGNSFGGIIGYNFRTIDNINPITGTDGNDVINGTEGSDSIIAKDGNDLIKSNGGRDFINGGYGIDTAIIDMKLSDVAYFGDHEAVTFTSTGGTQVTLMNLERVQLSDALLAFDTNPPLGDSAGGNTWQAAALYRAGFGVMPDMSTLHHWVIQADQSGGMGDLGQRMIDHYAPEISSTDLVSYLYQKLVGITPGPETIVNFVENIGAGKQFENQGELFAYAANMPLNTDLIINFVGQAQILDMY